MASNYVKVEVICNETIKPSSPTPLHLRTLSLSVFDQFEPEIYIPLLLFYPKIGNIHHRSSFVDKSKLLKTSLSEALTLFYPFAGEFNYNISISCNDHGAAFLESQVNCPMSLVLGKPDFRILKQLLPTAIESKQAEKGYLLLVQANLFKCGGLAIGVTINHKVADASTICAFIKSWAAIAHGLASSSTSTDHVPLPAEFGVAASISPPIDCFNSPQAPVIFSSKEKSTTRRFVFDASKIAALKSKAASASMPNPTRVEVVSALIWKCIIQASREKLGFIKPSVWCQVVNMRKRYAGQPLAENILGNFVWCFSATATVENEVGFESMVVKLRKGIEEYKEMYQNGVTGDVMFQFLKESENQATDDGDIYTCSSWCRFPFYEVANFGWGKPAWVTSLDSLINGILLMDMRDSDGIEASLSLKDDVMAIFETNVDLLTYASLNPTVI